jgi:hypothetical protein
MAQRGRKSAQLLALPVDGLPPRLKAPAYLNARERKVFSDTVDACDARHFVPSDTPLLAAFAQAAVMSRESVGEEWERATRVLISLATELRLAPSTRSDPRTTARRQPQHKIKYPWDTTRDSA